MKLAAAFNDALVHPALQKPLQRLAQLNSPNPLDWLRATGIIPANK